MGTEMASVPLGSAGLASLTLGLQTIVVTPLFLTLM